MYAYAACMVDNIITRHLYSLQAGGYKTPFLVMGGLFLFFTVPTIFLLKADSKLLMQLFSMIWCVHLCYRWKQSAVKHQNSNKAVEQLRFAPLM